MYPIILKICPSNDSIKNTLGWLRMQDSKMLLYERQRTGQEDQFGSLESKDSIIEKSTKLSKLDLIDRPEQYESRCPIDIINRRGHLHGYDSGLNPEDGELL